MQVVTDCHFEIGKTHRICQDYACQGALPVPYVIVTDGCSAAADVDVGARLLALQARQTLPTFVRTAVPGDNTPALVAQHWQLGLQVVAQSIRQATHLGLNKTAVDASLLIAFLVRDCIRVHVYGDGCLIGKRHDGTWRAVQIEFAHNAPYYLTYLEDTERQQLYAEMMVDQGAPQRIRWIDNQQQTTETRPYDAPAIFEFPLAEFPLVVVTTDGLSSFFKATDRVFLDFSVIAEEFIEFSEFDSDFLKRRLRNILENYANNAIYNIDDIGCGVFALVDSY